MIRSKIKAVAAIAVGAIIAGLLVALLVTRGTLADTRAQFEQWKISVAHGEAEARAKALANKIEKERDYAIAAQHAQADYDALRERYAGLVRAKAADSPSGRANLPGTAQRAFVPVEPPEGAELLAGTGNGVPFGAILIPQADALICAENTAYAQAAHGWAVVLMGISSATSEETVDHVSTAPDH